MTLQMCVVERKRILFSGMWVDFFLFIWLNEEINLTKLYFAYENKSGLWELLY